MMYTYKCEKCGKEFELHEQVLFEPAHHDNGDRFHYNDESPPIEKYWKDIGYCGGELYRVYKPPFVVIKGVR